MLEAERFAREAHDAGIHYDLEALSVDTLRQLPQQVSAIPPLFGWVSGRCLFRGCDNGWEGGGLFFFGESWTML